MIISKTPIRVSFIGGGSDIVRKEMKIPGQVFSSTIDKYIYVIIKKRVEKSFRISYSKNEIVKKISHIKNPIIRAVLEYKKISNNDYMEIVTVADIPSSGSGLGSSSALAVGLLKAISELKNEKLTKNELAKQAYYVERNILKNYLGYQDHFNAAFGGLRNYKFFKDHKVKSSIILKNSKDINDFQNHILIFYTGINRIADKILSKLNNKKSSETIDKVASLTENFIYALKKKNYKKCGELMSESWVLKKNYSNNVTNNFINKIYNIGIKSGAYGGKILGAGGGGYFVFICPVNKKKNIIQNLSFVQNIKFKFDYYGSNIVYK